MTLQQGPGKLLHCRPFILLTGIQSMSKETLKLLEVARRYKYSAAEKEEHRRSFAFGNTKIENPRITRELIDREAEKLEREQRAASQTRRV